MKRVLVSTRTLSVILGMVLGCSSQVTLNDTPSPVREEPVNATAAWLRTHARPVELEAELFDDLEFLRPLLEGKRIVQLGENTHGAREYNLLKSRLVRFMHQELGYEVLAFESALYPCYDSDLTAAEAHAAATLTRCAFGVWHTKGVLPLFDYLRATRNGERPLRLAGIDVQPIGNNKADRPQFLSYMLEGIDADYAAEVFALDSLFLEVYARDRRDRSAYFRAGTGKEMAEAYDRFAVYIDDNADAILATSTTLTAEAVLVARQTAASMAGYIRQQSAPTTEEWFERRDQGMAENLIFLLDRLYPEQKVIVWGHNFHLRHDNIAIPPDSTMYPDVAVRTMGSWIHERYDDELYTIGLYAYEGRVMKNNGDIYEIAPAGRGSVEDLLHGVGNGALFVDLSRAGREAGTTWMRSLVTARYNGTTALPMVLRDQYDAILFVDEVTPREMIH